MAAEEAMAGEKGKIRGVARATERAEGSYLTLPAGLHSVTSHLLGPRSREMMANKSLTRDGRSLGARRPRAGPLGNITTFSSIGTSEGPYSLVSRTLCALAGKDDRPTDHATRVGNHV